MRKVIVRKRLDCFEVVFLSNDNEHQYSQYYDHSLAVMNGQELAKGLQVPFYDNYNPN